MINHHLITDCITMQQIKARFQEAKAKKNTAGMEAAREDIQRLWKRIEGRGEGYMKIYQFYEAAAERGNECIDLNDVIWEKDVEALIASFRENGIERFTFYSTWSGAVKVAWLFTENGCTLEGMVKVNGSAMAFDGEGYEKVPAYLFTVH